MRGDPVAVIPSLKTVTVKKLTAVKERDGIRLTWELPEEEDFPLQEIKSFILFRAEVPDGITPEDCACEYRTIDFISPVSEPQPSLLQRLRNRLGGQTPVEKKTYAYLDTQIREGVSYMYKIVIMDKKNRMGKGSKTVFVGQPQSGQETPKGIAPGAPAGLVGLYTRENIVLTWDEITDQPVTLYRVYRSEGEDFSLIGEAVTPAFTDTNIVPRKKYYYRVSSVSDGESPLSEPIEVVTEPR